MTAYLVLFPILILMIFLIIRLIKLNNQASALYRFCDLRRAVMSYLRDNYENISPEEFSEIEGLLDNLEKTISHFHRLRIDFFKFPRLFELVNEIVRDTEKNERVEYSSGSAREFGEQLTVSYLNAFARLVPFFTWRLPARFIILLLRLFILMGVTSFESFIKKYEWFKDKREKHNLRHCRLV